MCVLKQKYILIILNYNQSCNDYFVVYQAKKDEKLIFPGHKMWEWTAFLVWHYSKLNILDIRPSLCSRIMFYFIDQTINWENEQIKQ